MAIRLIFSALLILSVLFLPIYISLIVGVVGMFYFELYVEAMGLLFLNDLLYGVREDAFHGVVYIASLSALVLFVGIELLKRKLKFYAR